MPLQTIIFCINCKKNTCNTLNINPCVIIRTHYTSDVGRNRQHFSSASFKQRRLVCPWGASDEKESDYVVLISTRCRILCWLCAVDDNRPVHCGLQANRRPLTFAVRAYSRRCGKLTAANFYFRSTLKRPVSRVQHQDGRC